MIVEQIWTANSGRNFNYLIACAETGEALAGDVCGATAPAGVPAAVRGWRPKTIFTFTKQPA